MGSLGANFTRSSVRILMLSLAVCAISIAGYLALRLGQPKQLTQTPPPAHFTYASSTPLPVVFQPAAVPAVLGVVDTNLNFQSGNSYSNGGVLVLSTNKDPKVEITSYGVSGTGNFTLYKVSKEELQNYLLYTEKDSSTYGSSIASIYQINTGSLTAEQTFQQEVYQTNGYDNKIVLNLPLTGTGIWFLQGKIGDKTVETMLVRSNLAGIVHRGDNQDIFWVQDNTYASVPDATIDLLNSKNTITSLSQLHTNQDGLATFSASEALDFALVSRGDDVTIIPVNLENLNYRGNGHFYSYSSFTTRQSSTKSYMFTDRFLYKPGDTVFFKAIIRNDDDADYSITPKTLTVTMGEYDKPFFQKTFVVSDLGTIDGSIQIPKDLIPTYYELSVKDGADDYVTSTGVQVAQFRKPDSTVSIHTDKLAYLPGEKLTATVKGVAFLGQPLRNKEVRYKVYESDSWVKGDYNDIRFVQQLQGYSPYKTAPILEGSVTLDKKGLASFELPVHNTSGFRKFWTIHIEYLDASGNATNDAVQSLIQPGDFVIESQAYVTGVQDKEVRAPLQLLKNKADANIANVRVSARLMVNTNGGGYVLEQDNLSATSDDKGKFQILFTPKQSNSYQLELQAPDASGNTIRGLDSFYISKASDANNNPTDIFTTTLDKETYNVGDTATVNIRTLPEIKQIFVSVGRSYSRDYRILPVNNGQASFQTTVLEKYQPNVFVAVGSFYKDAWLQDQTSLRVNTDDKNITVTITPNQKVYGPGETATFDVLATDGQNRPVATDMAFWLFDKALLELHGVYFDGIFEQFWNDRFFSIPTNYSYQGISNNGAEGGGGCFAGDTLVLMADGSRKRIDEIKEGDTVSTFMSVDTKQLGSAQVTGTHKVTVGGYLILNTTLRVTPEHKLYVNGTWKTAGEVVIGDVLVDSNGKQVSVSSIEWLKTKTPVYNLQIEKYHTFFANDMYVHNDKGDIRSVFKDTAYWNPHITTGEDGRTKVTVTLPDNLTTWVAAGVAGNARTQVGDGLTEVTVTKNLVVTPILPGFLRVGDQITLSALVHNFTKTKSEFSVEATFKDGELNKAKQSAQIDSEDFEEFVWPTRVTQVNKDSAFRIRTQSVQDTSLIDDVTVTVPVYEFGSWQSKFAIEKNATEIPLTLSSGTDTSRSSAVLTLRAMEFPEFQDTINTLFQNKDSGEVTTLSSALIGASLAKQYGSETELTYGVATANQIAKNAIASLKDLRSEQGIWVTSGDQNYDVTRTRMALEALSIAQKAGYAVDNDVITKALAYVSAWNPATWEYKAEQQYIFSLFPDRQLNRQRLPIQDSWALGQLPRALLANQRQGFKNTDADVNVLLSTIRETPTQVAWVKSSDNRYLQVGLPTIWGVRALQEIGGYNDKVQKALAYMYRNQYYDAEVLSMQAYSTVQYYMQTQQTNPSYQFKILQGNSTLGTGSVTPANGTFTPIELNADALTKGSLRIEKTGAGQLFSRLETKEFYTDRESPPQSHNLTLTRKYLSTKEEGQPTEVGDLVLVQFTVTGLGVGETDITIDDYLPSGLVAIDQTLDNGNFDPNGSDENRTQQQLTEQGIHLTFSEYLKDSGTYTYKTRVISEGTFDTPPAVVKLTNEPAIWASTNVDRLVVDGKHALETFNARNDIPRVSLLSKNIVWFIVSSVVSLAVLVVGFIAYLKRASLRAYVQRLKTKDVPPIPPTLPETP